jgi:LysM repeat protein
MIADKKYLLFSIIAIFFITGDMFSQEQVNVSRSENKVILEGKVYYVHVVKLQQTLYSIAKAYNVSEKEIMIENPGASANLIIGQVLKIPSNPSSAFSVHTGNIYDKSNVHILKQGETLYSLSKAYGCTVNDLLNLNPDIKVNDLPIGTEILLPGKEIPQNKLSFDEEGYILHKVKKGETLSTIARYYQLRVKEIKSTNPELGWGGPHSGDIIKIPKPDSFASEFITKDSIVDIISIDSTLEFVDSSDVYTYDDFNAEQLFRRTYKIAYLIPFDFKEQEPLDSLLKNVKSALRKARITEDYIDEQAKPQSLDFLEFLEGSLLAVDELTNSGVELDIKVFDTKKSMYQTSKILEDPALAKMDLIIGPFYPYNLELVSAFALENKIPCIFPFHSDDSLLISNPYLFQPNPSFKVEYKHNAEYIGRSYNSNLIFIHNGDSSQIAINEYYKDMIFKELNKNMALESVSFKEVIVKDGNTEDMVDALTPGVRNLVILPTRDEAFASQVASRLYYELDSADIEIFGSSYWVGFNNIEIAYIHALSLRISHTHWYNYKEPEFIEFMRMYRKNYYSEPENYTRRGCSFAIVGYDLSKYFISALKKYGPRFITRMDDFQVEGTICKFRFEHVSNYGGYENTLLKYYYFNKDLDVEEVQLPELPPLDDFYKPALDDLLHYNRPTLDNDTLDIKDL